MCSALILSMLLLEMELPDDVHTLDRGATIPPSTRTLATLFSSGCFVQPRFLCAFLGGVALSAFVIPVIHDEAFRFPTPDMLEDLRASVGTVLERAESDVSPEQLVAILRMVFKEIAIFFQPQRAGMPLLRALVKELADRLRTRRHTTAERGSHVSLVAEVASRETMGSAVGRRGSTPTVAMRGGTVSLALSCDGKGGALTSSADLHVPAEREVKEWPELTRVGMLKHGGLGEKGRTRDFAPFRISL